VSTVDTADTTTSSADQTPPEKETTMKTMTCRALGGPCDLEHHGASADDVIKAQDRHLKEAVESGDTTHQEARDAMKSRWRHPRKSMGWYRDTKQAFAALAHD
jgi:predicted small metal-binding protein